MLLKLLHTLLILILKQVSKIILTLSLSFSFFSASVWAIDEQEPLPVVMLSETPVHAIMNDPNYVVEEQSMVNIWNAILANSVPKLQPKYEQMSMTRYWLEITKIPNACMLNKIKNPSRETLAIFTDYPFTIFPPVRLIMLKKNSHKVSQPFSMQNLTKNKLRIGITKARSYGPAIDTFITQNNQYFYVRAAEDSMSKLIDMLLKDRVDAIIDFSQVVNMHLEEIGVENNTVSLSISEASKPLMAYIACSNSPQGQAIIDAINNSYHTDGVKHSFQRFHYYYFGKEEYTLLKPLIESIQQ